VLADLALSDPQMAELLALRAQLLDGLAACLEKRRGLAERLLAGEGDARLRGRTQPPIAAACEGVGVQGLRTARARLTTRASCPRPRAPPDP
jgi:hypothetical protein